jgi:beta-glucosidase
VVQLYVSHPSATVPRAIKDLRGYRRVTLQPGETRTVRFSVPVSSLAYWNERTHGWVVESEPVKLMVGASSAYIRAEHTIRISGGGVKR